MTQALRQAIENDPRTLTEIAEAASVNVGVLSRFTRSQRSVVLTTADSICDALGFEVRLVRPRKRRP